MAKTDKGGRQTVETVCRGRAEEGCVQRKGGSAEEGQRKTVQRTVCRGRAADRRAAVRNRGRAEETV